MEDSEFLAMVADHMEAGLLENIMDMLRHDPALWRALPVMAADERGRVRLGAAALVEEFSPAMGEALYEHIPALARAFGDNPNPTVRGDIAYLISLIGGPGAREALSKALAAETHPAVRETIEDSLRDLG